MNIILGVAFLIVLTAACAWVVMRERARLNAPPPPRLTEDPLVQASFRMLNATLERQMALTEKLIIPPTTGSMREPEPDFPDDQPLDPELLGPAPDWTDDFIGEGPAQSMGQIPHPPAFPE